MFLTSCAALPVQSASAVTCSTFSSSVWQCYFSAELASGSGAKRLVCKWLSLFKRKLGPWRRLRDFYAISLVSSLYSWSFAYEGLIRVWGERSGTSAHGSDPARRIACVKTASLDYCLSWLSRYSPPVCDEPQEHLHLRRIEVHRAPVEKELIPCLYHTNVTHAYITKREKETCIEKESTMEDRDINTFRMSAWYTCTGK